MKVSDFGEIYFIGHKTLFADTFKIHFSREFFIARDKFEARFLFVNLFVH